MQYRTDIAGLRAVAVLPILLFHAGVSALPGGFVGVDVFFVISGFLITSIIVSELKQGRFSMLEFYRRRVARIVPALALMLVATVIVGAAVMFPSELRPLGNSATAAAVFASNFYFYLTTDYFGGAAELKPLLHTWSLAVEEQFYIVYPVLVFLVWRWWPQRLRALVAVACVLSFAVALYFLWRPSTASFYMLPTRAWELGLGALVALGAFPQVRSARLRQGLAITGLAAILVAVVLVRPSAWFPAPLALAPASAPPCSSPMARAP